MYVHSVHAPPGYAYDDDTVDVLQNTLDERNSATGRRGCVVT